MVNFVETGFTTNEAAQPSTPNILYKITAIGLFGWTILLWQSVASYVQNTELERFTHFWEGYDLAFCRVDVSIWGTQEYFGAFIMWASMILAMMVPVLWPVMRGPKPALTTQHQTMNFIWGYLSLWVLFCILAVSAQGFLHQRGILGPNMALTDTNYGNLSGAAVLLGAGLFQLSPLKQKFQTACRLHILNSETRHSFSFGFTHGVNCLKCCWPLMLIMFVFGLMNLWVMALLTVLMIVENRTGKPQSIATMTGIVLIAVALGLAIS